MRPTIAAFIRTYFRACFSICFIFFILIIAGSMGMLCSLSTHQLIDLSPLEQHTTGKATILLDDQGIEWARFQLDKRDPVPFEHMPTHLINAFIAAEDWSFFSHQGISFRGIARSLLVNIYHGRKVQGASTITQQLVKLLFFDQRKTFSRKLKEQLYALLVERQFTKHHIIQTYLNHVYFGCGIYGVQAASQRFWGINVADLTIDQAATLAAIVRSPARYCPLRYPLTCKKRRNTILQLMLQRAFIDTPTYYHTHALPITLLTLPNDQIALHLRETIRISLEHSLGKNNLYTGGFTVQTTLNRSHQLKAQQAFHKQCTLLKKQLTSTIDGALISIETGSGEIKALVGGADFSQSQYNRALQAHRQMGSILKPLIYMSAIDQGFNFAHTAYDEPFALSQSRNVWKPRNYNRRFDGQITLAYALSRSNNIVAIKTLLEIGAERIVNWAKQCHIKGPFHTYPSLALGCIDATLIEVAGMFNIFAHNGIYTEPHYIKWIKNAAGTKIVKTTPLCHRVIASRTSDQVAQVLKHGLQRLRTRYKPHEWIDAEAISKTGTTNESRTCWFVGSTPTLTTAVYIGCDDNRSLGANVFPVTTAFPIWLSFNRSITHNQKQFIFDPSLKETYINQYTGRHCHTNDPHAIPILL